jgi:integrase
MSKKIRPLSDLAIRACKPDSKMITLYDGEGLQLRISTEGTRSWIFNYVRPFQKKRNNIKIGAYPSIGLAQARALKLQYRQLVSSKIDPHRWVQQQRNQATFNALNTLKATYEQWFLIKSNKVCDKYAFNIQRTFEKYLLPALGHLPIAEITPMEVIEVLRPLEKAKKLETLSRLCQRINELMEWAINTGKLPYNRLAGIKAAFFSPISTRMKTITPEQLPALLQRLHTSDVAIASRCLLEFQLHTMVRPGEAVKARWQDIDFTNSIWSIPAEFMKMRRGHQVPLSKQCLAILALMRTLSNGDFVFPSFHRGVAHLNKETVNNNLKRIGYKNKLVAHGLRALASTVLNEKGFNKDWIETSLAHGDEDCSRRVYNNAEYLTDRRDMMNWWSDYIQAAANDNR